MLEVGDFMNDTYQVSANNKDKKFTVIAGPQEVCGTMCVGLEGYRGCYAEDGLTKVGDTDA